MTLRAVLPVFLMLWLLPGLAQETPPEPPFIYKRDYKRLLDSTEDRNSSLHYPKLLIRYLNNDSALTNGETLALMIGFTNNPKYRPLEDMEKEEEIFQHNKDGEFRAAVEKSRIYLPTHPLSLLVLREISFAYQRLAKAYQNDMKMDSAVLYQDSGQYFMNLNDRIMEAMIYSGKGRTPDAPIFSLGLADGEHFIPNVGFAIESKDTEWSKNGDFLEVITAIVDGVNVRKYYFVIQHAKKKIDDDKANEIAAQKSKKEQQKKKSDSKKKGKSAATPTPPPTENLPQPTDSLMPPPLDSLLPGVTRDSTTLNTPGNR